MNPPAQPLEENPYQAPREPAPEKAAELFFSFPEDSPETLRKTYGAREASVRTIGLFFYLLAAMGVINVTLTVASARFAQRLVNRANPDVAVSVEGLRTVMAVAGLIGAGLYLLLGLYLRRLQNWARWTAVVFMGFAVLGMIQTMAIVGFGPHEECIVAFCSLLFNLYIILRLLQSDTAFVVSPKYRQAVALTPGHCLETDRPDRAFLGTAVVFYLGAMLIRVYRSL